MKWKKLGLVFGARTYAQTPTPLVLDDRIRVFIAERDEHNKAFISSVDLDLDDPRKVIDRQERVLGNGKPGTFDDEGQMPSCTLRSGGMVNLYYSGWNSRNTIPYHNATGVAISRDLGEKFERAFDGPILDRNFVEPYLAVTPCIVGSRMWYVSGRRWERINDRYEPIYVICAAESRDGWNWLRDGKAVIEQAHPLECFSRPWVVKGAHDWHMWFCCRSAIDYRDGPGAYRLGYAKSADGVMWTRRDEEAGITVSDVGWDSTMVAYPAVVQAKEKLLMFYNGNTFGRHGFGVAVAE